MSRLNNASPPAPATVPYLPASTSFCAANAADLSILVRSASGRMPSSQIFNDFRLVKPDTAGNAGSVRQLSGSSWMLGGGALGLEWDAAGVGDDGLDLLGVHRTPADGAPRRHRRERSAVVEDELHL